MKTINLEQTVPGCPTIFEWKNKKGNNFYFRLRHGYAKIVNKTKHKIIVEDSFPGCDGVCSWVEVVIWAKEHNIKLNN